MDDFGFIIIRHVNSEKTNKYWNHNVKLLRTLYPLKKIVIIDDNSNYDYVKSEFDYNNLELVQSEFPGRGELLPYYYYLKYKFFANALIIHDSVFLHRRINFEKLNGINVIPLWFFYSDTENIENTKRIVRYLKNNMNIYNKITNSKEFTLLKMRTDEWFGCFGVQSYINLKFLQAIQEKYDIMNLIHPVRCRADRCCLERIFGAIFFTENSKIIKTKSMFGNIMTYQKWGYSFDDYMDDLKKGNLPRSVIKVWTGR
jgi:hypothetical protein